MRTAFFPFILIMMTAMCCGATVHWFEAEDFIGNGQAAGDATASGRRVVRGSTWYVFARGIPAPPDAPGLALWVRAKTDVNASWFLRGEAQKPFGWFQTAATEWQWVKVMPYHRNAIASEGTLPEFLLQRPTAADIPTARGWLDAVVITDLDQPAGLELLFQEKNNAPPTSESDDSGLLAALKNQRRITECPVLAPSGAPPVIDGRGDDQAWQHAPRLEHFLTIAGAGFARQQTSVRILRDRDFLYVTAELRDSAPAFLRKTRTRKNDQVWTDDCLEIYLDPGLAQANPHQLVINALGTRQDNLSRRIDEAGRLNRDLDWDAAATIGDDGWQVEARIPWRLIADAPPPPGDVWGINFCRHRTADNELSYWNNTGEYFSRPTHFGLLLFTDLPAKLTGLELTAADNRLRYYFASGSPDVAVTVVLDRDADRLARETQSPPPQDTPVVLSFEVAAARPGTYQLGTRITCRQQEAAAFHLKIKTYSNGLVSTAWPAEERGNTLHLLANTAQQCFFVVANHHDTVRTRPTLHVSVPEPVTILDPVPETALSFYYQVETPTVTATVRNGRKYRDYAFQFRQDLPPRRIEKQPFHQSVLLFFKTDAATATEWSAPVYHHLETAGEVEEEHAFTLRILPPATGRQPRQITVHNWLWTIAPSPGNWSESLRTQALIGFNAVEAGAVANSESLVREIRAHGLKIINNLWWHWQNKELLAAAPELTAKTFAGKDRPGMVCPTALLEQDGAHFRKTHERLFSNLAAHRLDGFVWDLEGPAAWDACFCPRCLAAFQKYIQTDTPGLTADAIRQRHARAWVDFACRQTTAMSRIFQEEAKKRRPDARYGFYSALPGQATRETYRADWQTAAPFLDLALPSYYASNPAALDDTFGADMKKTIAELRALSPKPMAIWATLTAGYGRNSSVNPSAALVKMKVLRSIASGMDGVSFWWWGPFDGLYYQKMAEATRIIADFEDFFIQGETETGIAIRHRWGKRMSSFVSSRNGKTLIILFNHDPSQVRDAEVVLPRPDTIFSYPDGQARTKTSAFTVGVPPLDVVVLHN